MIIVNQAQLNIVYYSPILSQLFYKFRNCFVFYIIIIIIIIIIIVFFFLFFIVFLHFM